MTTALSLPTLLAELHGQIEEDLARARKALAHPTDKGDASESIWTEVLARYLPARYAVTKAHVVDCLGASSEQLDVVIHDRQYSPFVFKFKGTTVVPAESVYAVFEAKQDLTAEHIDYAQRKVASVRRLHRTSLPVPTVDGERPAKPLHHMLGGIVTLSCSWAPPFGDTMLRNLMYDQGSGRLDIGCVASAGLFQIGDTGTYSLMPATMPATRFIFELIARLQSIATVPMIDVRAYAAKIP